MKFKTLFLATALFAVWAGAADTAVDSYMGDWQGSVTISGQQQPVCVYLIPLDKGRYEARFVADFGQRGPYLHQLRGEIRDGKFLFMDDIPFDANRITGATDKGLLLPASLWAGKLTDNSITGSITGLRKGQFELRQAQRNSPELGKRPPKGAVVLFDGTNLEQWQKRDGQPAAWKLLTNGVMEIKGGDIVSKEKFGDFQLHLEFRLPYMPRDFGQARANSGVYLQGRYETQVLDSYGLEGRDNECGGFYQICRPTVNMCAPPLQWQSYDITFHSAKLDASGNKTANARVTIIHNGVKIHDNFELPHVTPGGMNNKEGEPAGLLLQDHSNPVQYRNIWVKRL
jgi:hypothetical protein